MSTASDTQGEKAAAQPSKYGSGTSSGAGFGNKSTPSDTSNLDHSSTRLDKAKSIDPYSGATEFGSGTTAGAGAGNKGMDHVFSEDERGADGRMELKLDREDTTPYSNSTGYGSGSTAGAGFGNKTADGFGGDSHNDSTLGKIMEKGGNTLGMKNIAAKGREKREALGYGEDLKDMPGAETGEEGEVRRKDSMIA